MTAVFDWSSAPAPWNELGPEIAANLRTIAEGPNRYFSEVPRGTLMDLPENACHREAGS
jgi:hypothetical protein